MTKTSSPTPGFPTTVHLCYSWALIFVSFREYFSFSRRSTNLKTFFYFPETNLELDPCLTSFGRFGERESCERHSSWKKLMFEKSLKLGGKNVSEVPCFLSLFCCCRFHLLWKYLHTGAHLLPLLVQNKNKTWGIFHNCFY